MILSNKTKKHLKLFLTLFLPTVVYFLWFNKMVDTSFTLLSFFYLLLFVTTVYLFLNINENSKIIKIISFSFLTLLVVYSLINLLNYEVFNTFLRFSFGKGSNIYTLIQSLQDYYKLISLASYFLSFLLWVVYFYAVFILRTKYKNKELILTERPNLSKNWKSKVSFTLLTFFSLLLSFSLASYLQKNPLSTWHDNTVYASDIGFFGNIYSQAVISWKQRDTDNSAVIAVAGEKIENKTEELSPLATLSAYLTDLPSKDRTTLDFPGKIDKPNIIVYQLESVDKWAMKQDPNPMPFLKTLMDENISSKHFMANGCHTIDAEYSTMCSKLLHSGGAISDMLGNDKNFNCLPDMLKNDFGYETSVFHSNNAEFWNRNVLMKQWGINNYYFSPEVPQKANDEKILNIALEKSLQSGKPFFSYVIGHISHFPFTLEKIKGDNDRAGNDNIKPYSGNLNESVMSRIEIDEETTRIYLGYLQEVDRNLKDFFELLEEKGLRDNTVVVIFGDHRFYDFHKGENSLNFYDYNDIPFTIVLPKSLEYKNNQKHYISNIDIAPTILNLIEGENFEKPEQFVGQSIFSEDHPENVLLKCKGDLIFANDEVVMRGNSELDSYAPFFNQGFLKPEELDKYQSYLKQLSKYSDFVIDNNILR